jgi:predicted transposase YdaD
MPSRWHRFDRTLKTIAEQEPTGLLEWLAGVLSLPGPVPLADANLSKELLDSTREVDVVWRVEANGIPSLLHLEFQSKRGEAGRAEMGERLAGYVMRLYERGHLPVTSIVIYLQRLGRLPASPFLIPSGLGSRSTLRCDYEVIKMWELPPETVLARPYPLLWPLAGMMQGVKAETVVDIAQQIVDTSLAQEQKKRTHRPTGSAGRRTACSRRDSPGVQEASYDGQTIGGIKYGPYVLGRRAQGRTGRRKNRRAA